MFPAVATTAQVPPTTTAPEIAEPLEHWTSSTICVRDAVPRPGGAAIAAVWDRSFALGCGALVDSATGKRIGWLAVDDVATLANGCRDRTALRSRSLRRSPADASTCWSTPPAGWPAPYGVLPADVATTPSTTWLPSTDAGYFVGLRNRSWFDEDRASAASGPAGSATELLIYDSRTGADPQGGSPDAVQDEPRPTSRSGGW